MFQTSFKVNCSLFFFRCRKCPRCQATQKALSKDLGRLLSGSAMRRVISFGLKLVGGWWELNPILTRSTAVNMGMLSRKSTTMESGDIKHYGLDGYCMVDLWTVGKSSRIDKNRWIGGWTSRIWGSTGKIKGRLMGLFCAIDGWIYNPGKVILFAFFFSGCGQPWLLKSWCLGY